jgi:Spx/MgsR family transcriptional regulator
VLDVYGIPNCNTVKDVLSYLKESEIDFEFHNFKKSAPSEKLILGWKKQWGDWPVNKKGPTFRKIKDQWESADEKGKIGLLLDHTSAIKRPILVKDEKLVHIGKLNDELKSLI